MISKRGVDVLRSIFYDKEDVERSRRPLDTLNYRVWRLDDVLFETLGVLAG